MTLPDTLSEIETAARARGVAPSDLCRTLDISRATWQRWKAGTSKPSFDRYQAVVALAREYGVEA